MVSLCCDYYYLKCIINKPLQWLAVSLYTEWALSGLKNHHSFFTLSFQPFYTIGGTHLKLCPLFNGRLRLLVTQCYTSDTAMFCCPSLALVLAGSECLGHRGDVFSYSCPSSYGSQILPRVSGGERLLMTFSCTPVPQTGAFSTFLS